VALEVLILMVFTLVAKDREQLRSRILQIQPPIRLTNMLLLVNFQFIMDSMDDPSWNPKL
jgi:hypothetical protein